MLREQVSALVNSPQTANDNSILKNILSTTVQSLGLLSPPWYIEQPFALQLPGRDLLILKIFRNFLRLASVQQQNKSVASRETSKVENLVVLGPRRVGKTSLFQIMSLFGSVALGDRICPLFIEYSKRNIFTPRQILNFLTGENSTTIEEAIEHWTSHYGPPIFFIDNFQLLFEEEIPFCVQVKNEFDVLCRHSGT
jgi:hypothetical protein